MTVYAVRYKGGGFVFGSSACPVGRVYSSPRRAISACCRRHYNPDNYEVVEIEVIVKRTLEP